MRRVWLGDAARCARDMVMAVVFQTAMRQPRGKERKAR